METHLLTFLQRERRRSIPHWYLFAIYTWRQVAQLSTKAESSVKQFWSSKPDLNMLTGINIFYLRLPYCLFVNIMITTKRPSFRCAHTEYVSSPCAASSFLSILSWNPMPSRDPVSLLIEFLPFITIWYWFQLYCSNVMSNPTRKKIKPNRFITGSF